MDPKQLVKIILGLVSDYEPKITTLEQSDLPPEALSAVNKWISDNNIPVDDPDTEADFYGVTFKEYLSPVYVASFSGNDPDTFLLTAVIQDGKVIGESKDVAD